MARRAHNGNHSAHVLSHEHAPHVTKHEATAQQPAPPEEVREHGNWVLLATILGSSMAFIDGTALNVALPVIQQELNATGAELLWVINAYLLMLAALILISGALSDRFGRKLVFAVGIAIFMAGSLACGLTPGAGFLIGARAVQGLGGAMMIPGSLAIITAFFGPGQRGRAIGTWAAVTTVVTVVGPVLGGVLANTGLWRGVFFINPPIGIFALIVLYLHVPESRDPDARGRRIDFTGAALAIIGLAALTYGSIMAPEMGFSDPAIYLALIAGFLSLFLFVIVEWAGSHPMLPLRLFRSRTFSGANILTVLLYGALSVGFFFLALNMVQIQDYPPAIVGLAVTPFALILAGMSRWAGGLVDRFGPRKPLVAGPLFGGAGFFVMALPGITSGPAAYWYTYFPAIVLFGTGMGITVAPLTTAVMGALTQRHAGTASGVNNTASRAAGVLAVAALGSFMLFTFSSDLGTRGDSLPISAQARSDLQDEASRLGDAQVPDSVAPEDSDAVKQAIRLAFVDSFRRLILICAGLAWLGALIVVFTVPDRLQAMD